MLARAFVPVFAFATVGSSFLACVSDSSTGGGSSDAAIPDTYVALSDTGGGGNDASSTPDAEDPCPENFGECDGKPAQRCETDLRVNSEHCGACGRSCGGSVCKGGECANQQIVDARPQPISFLAVNGRLVWLEGLEIHGCLYSNCAADPRIIMDVNGNTAQPTTLPTGSVTSHLLATDGTDFFFAQCASNSNFDCAIGSCALGGCKNTGPTFLTADRQTRRPLILVNGGTKAGDPGLYTFHPLDGYTRYTPPLVPNGTAVAQAPGPNTEIVQAIHTDGTNLVWVDANTSQANPDGGLFLCPFTGCGTRKQLLPPPVKHLAVASNTAFVSTGAATSSSIVACAFAGCNQGGDVLATNQAFVSDIIADDKAVYWATTATATPTTNTVAGGQIMMCPLPKCAGGPKRIADTQLNPMALALDGEFIYWMNRGAPAPAKSGSIWRRRR